MRKYRFSLLFLTAVLSSCTVFSPYILDAPRFIRDLAFEEATRYIGMEYELGGQDFPKGTDCSGLVVNVYLTATIKTDYRLLFTDAAVSHLYG
ncbi:MAG: C40 family peptidase [Spirochaetes bacterium]|nr:C40 family peptidase [Spirochaetota bacterium]